MRILIIGGTQFLGRALVDTALAAGHTLTLFNRGQTNPDLYPDVEKLRGDRTTDVSALNGRTWDAVVDTCGYFPRAVRTTAQALAGSVEHYTFISSISVYGPPMPPDMDENSPVQTLDDETREDITGETYGPLKALSEQAAEDALPGQVLRVRAGLIVGPYDPTPRFTYWPLRVSRGGQVLAPPADAPAQYIDVRDLAEWIIAMAEKRNTGIYNVTGPAQRLTFADLLDACNTVSGHKAAFVHADEAFLLDHDVRPWADLPLWLPTTMQSMNEAKLDNVLASGIHYRSVEETARDTLAWYEAERGGWPLDGPISPEREAELLGMLT